MRLLILTKHLYLSHMWFDVAPKTCTKNQRVWRDQIACSKYDNHSKLNNQHNGGRGGEAIWPYNEHENIHFDNEKHIHRSSKITKKRLQSLFKFVAILGLSCVLYSKRSEFVIKKVTIQEPSTLILFFTSQVLHVSWNFGNPKES